MPKPTLTPANVNLVLDEIYLLTDAEVGAIADSMAGDFYGWINDRFALTTEQQTYISGAPTKVKKFWGYLHAACLEARGEINFTLPPLNPVPRRAKETRENLFGEVTYSEATGELTGPFQINVAFKLV